jgi:hypothetical protein
MANRPFTHRRPMNVHVARGSRAEQKYRTMAGISDLVPEALAPGLPPTPAHDLLFHGGKTLLNLEYTNLYVGGDAWTSADITAIDTALRDAMSAPTLNNVMAQYFSATPMTTFKPSRTLPGGGPNRFSQGDLEALLSDLAGKSQLDGYQLPSTVFNFLLPKGTILSDNPAIGAVTTGPGAAGADSEADSLNGLGGFHGSIVTGAKTLYYAVGVYSERRPDGTVNGIPVFDAAWKNVVATFYHELNEARTDPDVQQVIAGGPSSLLGWTSRSGEECGDFPVFEANPLSLVFQEVPLTKGGTVPVQFQYSNFVHGPEGPVATPRPPATAAAKHRRPKHR